MRKACAIPVAAAGLAFASVAFAQDNPIVPSDPQSRATRYDVHQMNFDMWCQEQQHLPPERCDKRLSVDDAAFSAYRAKIEKYEIPHLKDQQRDQQLSRGILHNDPVDHPDGPSQGVAGAPPPR